VLQRLQALGVLALPAGMTVLRLLPPLVIEDEADRRRAARGARCHELRIRRIRLKSIRVFESVSSWQKGLMSLENYAIIDSTLREGEQFINAHSSRPSRRSHRAALDEFGVEYLELTSPQASPGAWPTAHHRGLGLRAAS
jgi:hypothetical protein